MEKSLMTMSTSSLLPKTLSKLFKPRSLVQSFFVMVGVIVVNGGKGREGVKPDYSIFTWCFSLLGA